VRVFPRLGGGGKLPKDGGGGKLPKDGGGGKFPKDGGGGKLKFKGGGGGKEGVDIPEFSVGGGGNIAELEEIVLGAEVCFSRVTD